MTEALMQLWQRCFGDGPEDIRAFFQTAYAPERCMTLWEGEHLAAALYWLDCQMVGQKLAYLYAVGTDPDFRGRGLCRELMAKTHTRLEELGYGGSVLYPANAGLRRMYAGMGYRDFGGQDRFEAKSGPAVDLRRVTPAEYAALRRQFLPPDGVRQEGENLAYLSCFAQLYAGADFLLAAVREETNLTGIELLGNPAAAPGILGALGCSRGTFRIPGKAPFAMFRPLTAEVKAPGYFGLAFD